MISSLLSLYLASTLHITNSQINLPSESKNVVITELNQHLGKVDTKEFSPIKNPEMIAPIIGASSAIVIDLKTGEILFEKNPNSQRAIASITKLMTILITLEEENLEDIATISSNASNQTGSSMGLRTNEKISVKNLLLGAIIQSGNDAAVALAEHNAGTVEAFVKKMNKRAQELGLINTQFKNPSGLDQSGHYSSSYDLSILGTEVYKYPFIKEAAKTKELKVYSENSTYTHSLETTNKLLDSYLKIKGLKTGQTLQAGLCLITIAENNSQNEILTVVLNSPDRFQESKALIDWTFRAYTW